MSATLVRLVVLILAVAAVSGGYAYLRASTLTTADQLAAKGLVTARWDISMFYAALAVGVGILGVLVFRWMGSASPETARRSFLLLAVAIGLALEVLAAVVFKMRGLVDFTFLHVLQIIGFGWLLPVAYLA